MDRHQLPPIEIRLEFLEADLIDAIGPLSKKQLVVPPGKMTYEPQKYEQSHETKKILLPLA